MSLVTSFAHLCKETPKMTSLKSTFFLCLIIAIGTSDAKPWPSMTDNAVEVSSC